MVQRKTTVKKILYLSYDGMTDPLGQGQVLNYLTGLADASYEITLISFEKKQRFEKGSKKIKDICTAAGIRWMPLMYTARPPVLSTVYDIFILLRKTAKLHKKEKFDIVHCRGYITALAGLHLKRKFSVKFIFDMRGFWIDEKCEGTGGWNPNSFVYGRVIKYLRKKEQQFYNEANKIITLTQAAAKQIQKEHPAIAEKITVIPTCVNLNIFKPFDKEVRESIRKKLGISNKSFVLLYSGGAGPNYDSRFLFKAFEHFSSLFSDVKLLVLSKDNLRGTDDNINENIITTSVPYHEVYKYLAAGDVGIVNYHLGISVSGRSPTKLGEYWACGLSAISPAGIGDVDTLFAKYKGSGIIIQGYDFSSITSDNLETADKRLLREYSKDYFGLGKGIESYASLYSELLLYKKKEI